MIQHHLKLERRVNLGGVLVGPLRFFGRWYTLRSMPLITWLLWARALESLRATDPKGKDLRTKEVLLVLPIEVLRPLVRFMVPEIRTEDEQFITREQLLDAFASSSEVNDFAFIESSFESKGDGSAPPSDWTLEDCVDALVSQRPCYTHAEAWRLPAHEFCSHLATLERRAGEIKEDRDQNDPAAPKEDPFKTYVRR
jgi:hypothetical protein